MDGGRGILYKRRSCFIITTTTTSHNVSRRAEWVTDGDAGNAESREEGMLKSVSSTESAVRIEEEEFRK
jgi:hypothetical protein